MIVSNKFILIYSVSLCIILIAQTIIAIEQKNLKPNFVIEVNGIEEDPFNDFKCGKGYFSRISYIENAPKSLSNEEYAEKILNLENSLNLPTEFKSDKTEILDYLETKNNRNKQKRQLPDSTRHYGYEKSNYDVVITVTVYGKEQDVIIIKEVIPNNNNSDRDRYNVETELPLTTTTTAAPSPIRHRQPDYTVIGNWYPTIRTVHVHSTNTEYDRHPTEMTTTSSTSRPFNWGGWGWNNPPSHVTTTNTPTTSQSIYWSTPETTKSTWDLREYMTETTSSDTDYESETISSTPKSSQLSWGWFFSPDKSTTTTTTESSEPNYEYQTTSSYPVYNYWDTTTTVPSTTTTTTMKTLLSGWLFSPSFSDRAESTTEKSMMTTTTEYYNNSWDYIAPSTTSTTTTTTTTTTENSADLTTTTKKFSFFNIFG